MHVVHSTFANTRKSKQYTKDMNQIRHGMFTMDILYGWSGYSRSDSFTLNSPIFWELHGVMPMIITALLLNHMPVNLKNKPNIVYDIT